MMRFEVPERLVLGKQSQDVHYDFPIYTVANRWATCVERVERDKLATVFTDPVWCILRNTLLSVKSIEADRASCWKSITRRYDGVIKEWMLHVGTHTAIAPNAASTALAESHNHLCEPGKHWRLPVELWKAFERAIGGYAAIKPKFFLRAFVDEIPNYLERATVQSVAFAFGPLPQGDVALRRKLFASGCRALHLRLARDVSILSELTSGALTPIHLAHAEADPEVYFENLLLLKKTDSNDAVVSPR